MKININTTLLGILVILILVLIFKRPKAPDNEEMLNKIEEINITINSLSNDIKEIKDKKEEVKVKIEETKSSISKTQSSKLAINNKPYSDAAALEIIKNYFERRGIK